MADAEIIGTPGCVEDLREAPASRNRLLLGVARILHGLGAGGRVVGRALSTIGIDNITVLIDAGELALPMLSDFDFSSMTVFPNRTFEGELTLQIGNKKVELIEVGPAHTLGDAVVYVPGDKILFTGDILFKDAHPVIWQGPVTARKRYDAGLSADDAVFDIQLAEFDRWLDVERVYVNVHALYREFSGDTQPADVLALFAGMSRLRRRWAKERT